MASPRQSRSSKRPPLGTVRRERRAAQAGERQSAIPSQGEVARLERLQPYVRPKSGRCRVAERAAAPVETRGVDRPAPWASSAFRSRRGLAQDSNGTQTAHSRKRRCGVAALHRTALRKAPGQLLHACRDSEWTATLIGRGLAPATVTRALSTLRSLLQHAVADGRITTNPAAAVPRPRGAARREGRGLDETQVAALASACQGTYAELVTVLAYTGLRWGELAGLRADDLVQLPGAGLRVERALLASQGGGSLDFDSVKSGRARTVPLVAMVVPILERWVDGKSPDDPVFHSPSGGSLRESNWKRSICWNDAKTSSGYRKYVCTTCGIPQRRSGLPVERTRRSSSASSGTPPRL